MLFLFFVLQMYVLSTTNALTVEIDGKILITQNWEFSMKPGFEDWEARRESGEEVSSSSSRKTLKQLRHTTPTKRKLKRKKLKLEKTTESPTGTTKRSKHRVTRFYMDATHDSPEVTKKTTNNNHNRFSTKKRTKDKKTAARKHEPAAADNTTPKAGPTIGASVQYFEISLPKFTTSTTTTEKPKKMEDIEFKSRTQITLIYDTPRPKAWEQNSIYKKEGIFVKDDNKLLKFTDWVYQQSIKVFENIKSKVNSTRLQNKVEYLQNSYKNRMADFVNETRRQKILTRLGNQKVVLNTIETSNRFMRRLLNYLISDMWSRGAMRDRGGDLEIVLRNEVQNDLQQGYIHACQHFNICRSQQLFSDFLTEFSTIILQIDDNQLKQAMDALTETLKSSDLSRVMDNKLEKRIKHIIDLIEKAEPHAIRPMLWMIRNAIANKNQPISVAPHTEMKVVNRTVAFIEIIDNLDTTIQPTEENLLQWSDMKTSLIQWGNRERDDIQDIMQALIWQVINKGINKMPGDVAQAFHDSLKVIFE